MNPSPSIVGLSDIEALERVPLEQRDLPSSTYELLQRSAQRHGQRIALSCLLHGSAAEEPLRISYAELFARVTQTANALHRLGLESHQAVSFLLPNLPQTHYVIWGGEAAGIVNAINPLLEPEHIAELIRASNTRVLVTLAPFPGTDLWQKVAGLRAQLPELYAIVVVDPANLLPAPQREALKAQRGPLPEGVLDFDTLIADCPADRLESGRAIHPDDVASYFHTGGTTGTPKLAPHSHFNEVAMAEIMGLNADYGVDDVLLCGLPLFHVNGVMVTGLAPFHRGAQVLLAGPQGYRNPTLIQDFWKLVERYRVTSFSGVPTIYAALLQVPSDGRDLSSLRFALCGAAPMPVELIRQFEARTGLKVIEGSKDLIIRGGHNIDPQMIEEALHRHPAVALAAAVGKPDAKAGELPVAYIQLKPGASASEEELLEHASRHVPERAAVPKDIWLIESMPVTAVGKTFKPALRLDAIRRVLEEESRRIAEDIRVEVVADERHGQLAHLHVPALDERRQAALEAKRRVDHVVLVAVQVQDRNPLVALVQRQVVEGRRVGG